MPHLAGRQMLHLWSLSEDVVVKAGAGEELVLSGRFGTERIEHPDPFLREALRRMELGPVLPANVEAVAANGDFEADACPVPPPTLSRLSHLVVRTLGLDDLKGPLLSVSPASRHASFAPVRLAAQSHLRLRKDVSLTLEEPGVVVRSAASLHRVVLHRPEAAWVASTLAWAVTPDEASAALPLPPEVTEGILRYLAAAGMTAPARSAGTSP
ncbi:NADH oxidase [Streptomyces sp. NPDC003016]